jgi:ABC-type transporter Mla MlaB component
MQMTIESVQGKVPVTILALRGDLDASNFESVIAKAKEIYSSGARHLLVDMSELNFMSSSGLVALHSIILLMRGENPPDLQAGWDAFRAIDRERASGPQPYVKLLSPQPKVLSSLQKTGMDEFFEIFTDRQTALASF